MIASNNYMATARCQILGYFADYFRYNNHDTSLDLSELIYFDVNTTYVLYMNVFPTLTPRSLVQTPYPPKQRFTSEDKQTANQGKPKVNNPLPAAHDTRHPSNVEAVEYSNKLATLGPVRLRQRHVFLSSPVCKMSLVAQLCLSSSSPLVPSLRSVWNRNEESNIDIETWRSESQRRPDASLPEIRRMTTTVLVSLKMAGKAG
jgi:hypothetical protein